MILWRRLTIKTYQDLVTVPESDKAHFIFSAISEHKSSNDYKIASDAELYASGQNATISQYQKMIYNLQGGAVPDKWAANHKCKSEFFKRFVIQLTSYQVGNGVTFTDDSTKEKLGKNFDTVLYKAVKSALVEKVSFNFFNYDHVETFKFKEFVPLYDEETGVLRAGIRFWRVGDDKDRRPEMATLYEEDGYTEYVKKPGELPKIKALKKPYIKITKSSAFDGKISEEGKNYSRFPIIPLYGNFEKQSELVGIRENIDCYDLIKSGFANDLADASMFYWTISNASGMDDEDLAKFVEHMKVIHAAVVSSDEDGAKAEAHTMDIPYQSREVSLDRIAKDLYKDSMALDTEQIAAGNVTATQIQAAYEPLNEKADELEMCLFEFFDQLFEVAGIDDTPSFERSQISNQPERTQMVLSAAEYLDDETILNKLPFLTDDEIEEILQRKDAEEVDRFSGESEREPQEPSEPDEMDEELLSEVDSTLDEIQGELEKPFEDFSNMIEKELNKLLKG